MDNVAINQNENGVYTISYENGMLKRENSSVSIAKHNLLCFGRLNKNLTKNQKGRLGDIGNYLESKPNFSICWMYYREGIINQQTMQKIIEEFNNSCDRDLKNKVIDKKVILKSVRKLDRNVLGFTISIGGSTQEITINL